MVTKMNDIMKKNITSITVILLCGLFLLLPQLYLNQIIIGHDTVFHFNRFYDIFEQINHNSFNYFQMNYGFNGSGRIVNALYGYDNAFFHGLLLYWTHSWFKLQLISSYLCMIIAGGTMFFLCRYLDIKYLLSTLAAITYMVSAPIMYYVLYGGFSGWGSAFLPLIFISAFKSIKDSDKPISPILLAVPMSILLNTHLLTALLATISLIPFFSVSLYINKNKVKWIRQLLLAILLAIFLSLNTIYSYLEVYLNNNILSPFLPENMIKGSVNINLSNQNDNYNLGVFISLIFISTIVFAIYKWKYLKLDIKLSIITGTFFLFLSSSFVPWNQLVQKVTVLEILQFPFRFSVVAYILLIISFFYLLNAFAVPRNELVKPITVIFIIFFALNVQSQIFKYTLHMNEDIYFVGANRRDSTIEDQEKAIEKFRSNNLSEALSVIKKATPDYLPIGSNQTNLDAQAKGPYSLYKKYVIDNQTDFNRTVLEDGRINLTWYSDNEDVKNIPAIIYNDTSVELNQKNIMQDVIQTTEIGSLVVPSKKGDNQLILGYKPTVSVKYILWIKIISWATVIFIIIFRWLKLFRKSLN